MSLPGGASQPWIRANAELRSALERPPKEQREALPMIGGMGLSYDEYAEISGCLIGAARNRLFRAPGSPKQHRTARR